MNVAFATGCFMMVRTHVIAQQLGGFDPHYFLYHEDSDLSRRVLANGGSILYTPDICVTHHGSVTAPTPSLQPSTT